jgi:hypothetical protein
VQTALNVVEAYGVRTLTALGTICNFSVWVILENSRSLEIGVRNMFYTGRLGGERGELETAIIYNKQRLLVISIFK